MANTTDLNQDSNQGSTEALRDSVINAVGSITEAMQPQINEFATKAARGAVDRSVDLSKRAYKSAQRHPYYLIGFAAIVLVAAAALIGTQSSDLHTSDKRQIH